MKYHNKKITIDGIKFDSKKEGEYYLYLKDQKKKGKIVDFELQPKFELIPNQKNEFGKLTERKVTYRADFKVLKRDIIGIDHRRNPILGCTKFEIIDVKGMKTRDYIIKRKLMLWVHGIIIREE